MRFWRFPIMKKYSVGIADILICFIYAFCTDDFFRPGGDVVGVLSPDYGIGYFPDTCDTLCSFSLGNQGFHEQASFAYFVTQYYRSGYCLPNLSASHNFRTKWQTNKNQSCWEIPGRTDFDYRSHIRTLKSSKLVVNAKYSVKNRCISMLFAAD